MMTLGLLIAGPVADWLGVRFRCIVGGSVCILAMIAATFVPVIMNIEQNQVSAEPSTT
jgi:MFS family permease